MTKTNTIPMSNRIEYRAREFPYSRPCIRTTYTKRITVTCDDRNSTECVSFVHKYNAVGYTFIPIGLSCIYFTLWRRAQSHSLRGHIHSKRRRRRRQCVESTAWRSERLCERLWLTFSVYRRQTILMRAACVNKQTTNALYRWNEL